MNKMPFASHKLIQGTLILTLAGIFTRVIGFVYKIYLAKILGTQYLGLYQLVFPVYILCFTIYGSGIQTAISQVIASNRAKKNPCVFERKILFQGMTLGISLACILAGLVFFYSDVISLHFVMEPRIAPYLRILALLFPFCSAAACISGYYFGIRQAKIPAIAQLIEQIARIGFVFCAIWIFFPEESRGKYGLLAVMGLVVGEIAACLYQMIYLKKEMGMQKMGSKDRTQNDALKRVCTHGRKENHITRTLLYLAVTITLTRLMISFLHSVESLLLPAMLRKYGCSAESALSIYGVLNGMSMAFIFFPSTISNSFSVLLLPSIAENYAANHHKMIRHSVTLSTKYCVIIGLVFQSIFFFFGKELGLLFFQNASAGDYLVTLSFLCPFLYLASTFTSIINGMEKTKITFLFTLISLLCKIAILLVCVPIWGIRAYLFGLLFSEILLILLESAYLRKYLFFDFVQWLLYPYILLILLGVVSKYSFYYLCQKFHAVFPVIWLGFVCAGLFFLYFLFLLLTGIVSKKEFQQENKKSS